MPGFSRIRGGVPAARKARPPVPCASPRPQWLPRPYNADIAFVGPGRPVYIYVAGGSMATGLRPQYGIVKSDGPRAAAPAAEAWRANREGEGLWDSTTGVWIGGRRTLLTGRGSSALPAGGAAFPPPARRIINYFYTLHGNPLEERPRAPGRVISWAGPGDPGLITVRGLEALGRADAVLYEPPDPARPARRSPRLPPSASTLEDPGARGGAGGDSRALLSDRARRGRRGAAQGRRSVCVRRGGEEFLACRAAGSRE
jgi:hypothetical protein